MWIQHPSTGVVLLVRDQAHIDRLLGEGGHEVPDPRIPPQEPEQAQESEVATDASEVVNVGPDSPRETHDRGPSGGKSALPGLRHGPKYASKASHDGSQRLYVEQHRSVQQEL